MMTLSCRITIVRVRLSRLYKPGDPLQRKPTNHCIGRGPNRDFKDEAAPLRFYPIDPVPSGRNTAYAPTPVLAVCIMSDEKRQPKAEQRFNAPL
jgi:hypothetical protein